MKIPPYLNMGFLGTLGDIGKTLIAPISSSLANQAFANYNLKKQVKAQKELSDYNTQLGLETWRQQASEQAQLQKQGLQKAGMSPAGFEGSSVGFGSAAMSGGMPSMPTSGFIDFNQSRLVQSQIDLNKAQADATSANVPLTQQQTRQLELMNEITAKTKDAKTASEIAAALRYTYENKAYGDVWKNILTDPNSNKQLLDSVYSTISEPIQRVKNLIQEQKNLEATEKETLEKAANYAEVITLGYAGLKNGMSIAEIQAAVQKYTADKGLEGVTMSLDKSLEGFLLGILDEAGLKKDAVEFVKAILNPKAEKNSSWFKDMAAKFGLSMLNPKVESKSK